MIELRLDVDRRIQLGASTRQQWLVAMAVLVLASCTPAASSSPASTSGTAQASEPGTASAPAPVSSLVTSADIPVRQIHATEIAVPGASDFSLSGNLIWMIVGSKIASLDVKTHAVKTIDVGAGSDALDGIEVTKTTIWIADFGASKLIRLDRAPGSKPVQIPMADAEDVLAVGDSIWVTNHHEGSVTRIDAKSNAVIGTTDVGQVGFDGPQRLAFGDGSVWVDESNESSMIRLDPTSGAVIAKIALTHLAPCGGILATDTAVWATGCHDSTVMGRIDPATNTDVAGIRLDAYGQDVSEVNDAIWVPVGGPLPAGELERIDPVTTTVTTKLSINGLSDVTGSVVAANALWVSNGINSVFEVPLSELTP
jgi:streptogramin lyase